VLPDFSKPDPLLTFKLDDVAFVYGSKWKQRYLRSAAMTITPCPRSGTSPTSVWRPYFVQPNTDWWVPHYPADNMQRPTGGALCDGCHSVNYDLKTNAVTEWNVAASGATVRAATTSRNPRSQISSNPREARFRSCERHVVFNATHRDNHYTTRSRASTSTGPPGSSRANS
jgi:hypothetical protein